MLNNTLNKNKKLYKSLKKVNLHKIKKRLERISLKRGNKDKTSLDPIRKSFSLKNIKSKKLSIKYRDWNVTTKIISMSLILVMCILLTLVSYKSLLNEVSNDDMNLLKAGEDLTLNIQRMNYFVIAFLEEDTNNLDFYSTGESENISKFEASYAKSKELIDAIESNKSYEKLKTETMMNNLGLIKEDISLVNSNFLRMIDLTHERGFSSIGKVSELGSVINVLEGQLTSYLDADFLNYLLSQKKYESTYFANQDRKIATKLLINSSAAIDIAKEKSYPDEIINEIEANVNDYNMILSSLQKINVSINELKDHNGKLSENLSLNIQKLQEDINISTKQKIENNTSYVDIITFGIVLFSIIFSTVVSKYISKPIVKLNERLEDIAEGDGDLTKRLDVINNSELGLMSNLFNKVLINITSLISKVKSNSEDLNTSTNQISVAMKKAGLDINEISLEINQISSSIENDAILIKEALYNVNELSNSAREISLKSIDAVEETEDILKSSKQGTDKLNYVIHEIENVKETSSKINDILKDLSKSSNEISGINTVISKIADQTSMLSLNAAIEAARAGEHGRGFSVVANEIKTLADESKKSIQNINNIIEATIKSISLATKLTNDEMIQVENVYTDASATKVYFDEILELIVEINHNIKHISDLSKKQSSTSEVINTSIDELSTNLVGAADSSKNISRNIESQSISTEDINRQVANLRNMATQLYDLTLNYKV